MIKKILLALLVVLVVIQFIRPGKNISSTISANDITLHYAISSDVLNILKKSCYDCHSNNTVYPWYNNIQPVAWWLQYHVNDGKKELNFSEFYTYPAKKQSRKLHELVEQVKGEEMPLNSYLWIHKDAKLDERQKNAVMSWADSLQKMIAVKNNLPAETNER